MFTLNLVIYSCFNPFRNNFQIKILCLEECQSYPPARIITSHFYQYYPVAQTPTMGRDASFQKCTADAVFCLCGRGQRKLRTCGSKSLWRTMNDDGRSQETQKKAKQLVFEGDAPKRFLEDCTRERPIYQRLVV